LPTLLHTEKPEHQDKETSTPSFVAEDSELLQLALQAESDFLAVNQELMARYDDLI